MAYVDPHGIDDELLFDGKLKAAVLELQNRRAGGEKYPKVKVVEPETDNEETDAENAEEESTNGEPNLTRNQRFEPETEKINPTDTNNEDNQHGSDPYFSKQGKKEETNPVVHPAQDATDPYFSRQGRREETNPLNGAQSSADIIHSTLDRREETESEESTESNFSNQDEEEETDSIVHDSQEPDDHSSSKQDREEESDPLVEFAETPAVQKPTVQKPTDPYFSGQGRREETNPLVNGVQKPNHPYYSKQGRKEENVPFVTAGQKPKDPYFSRQGRREEADETAHATQESIHPYSFRQGRREETNSFANAAREPMDPYFSRQGRREETARFIHGAQKPMDPYFSNQDREEIHPFYHNDHIQSQRQNLYIDEYNPSVRRGRAAPLHEDFSPLGKRSRSASVYDDLSPSEIRRVQDNDVNQRQNVYWKDSYYPKAAPSHERIPTKRMELSDADIRSLENQRMQTAYKRQLEDPRLLQKRYEQNEYREYFHPLEGYPMERNMYEFQRGYPNLNDHIPYRRSLYDNEYGFRGYTGYPMHKRYAPNYDHFYEYDQDIRRNNFYAPRINNNLYGQPIAQNNLQTPLANNNGNIQPAGQSVSNTPKTNNGNVQHTNKQGDSLGDRVTINNQHGDYTNGYSFNNGALENSPQEKAVLPEVNKKSFSAGKYVKPAVDLIQNVGKLTGDLLCASQIGSSVTCNLSSLSGIVNPLASIFTLGMNSLFKRDIPQASTDLGIQFSAQFDWVNGEFVIVDDHSLARREVWQEDLVTLFNSEKDLVLHQPFTLNLNETDGNTVVSLNINNSDLENNMNQKNSSSELLNSIHLHIGDEHLSQIHGENGTNKLLPVVGQISNHILSDKFESGCLLVTLEDNNSIPLQVDVNKLTETRKDCVHMKL